jgi:hypothetical protein
MIALLRIIAAGAAAAILAGCAATTAKTLPDEPASMTETGSRIPAGANNCTGIGRSYSNEEIHNTGATSAADALRLLDPSVTVHQ